MFLLQLATLQEKPVTGRQNWNVFR